MNKVFLRKLQTLLSEIYEKKQNYFHHKYVANGIKKQHISSVTKDVFQSLPPTTLEELAHVRFKNRLLYEGPGFHKLAFSKKAKKYLLLHRTLDEIKKDMLPLDGTRPLVLMENTHEAIERCLFFYTQDIIPLIGEIGNPAIVYATAKQYKIDSVFIDSKSINTFRDELLKLTLPIQSVTIIDEDFTESDFTWPKKITVNGILSLPEIGRIAYVCKQSHSQTMIFHSFDDTFIEPSKNTILTSVRLDACPMIRYQSDLKSTIVDSECPCKKISYVFS